MKLSLCFLLLLLTGVLSKHIEENVKLRAELKKLLTDLHSYNAKTVNKKALDQSADTLLKNTLQAATNAKSRHKKVMDEHVDQSLKKTLHDLLQLKKALVSDTAGEKTTWTEKLQQRFMDNWGDLDIWGSGNGDGWSGTGSGDGSSGSGSGDGSSGSGSGDGSSGSGSGNGSGGNGSGGNGNGGNGSGGNGSGGNGSGGNGSGGNGSGGSGGQGGDTSCGVKQKTTKSSNTRDRSMLRELLDLLGQLRREKKIQSKIVNGHTASVADYPWTVALLFDGADRPDCGGSLIKPNWVLTAAHCFKGISSADQIKVRVGEHDFSNGDEKEVHEDIDAETFFKHSGYDDDTVNNDIALIKLSRAATVEQVNINTICLTGDQFPVGTKCIVSGWGVINDAGTKDTDVLRFADLTLVDTCDDLKDTQLCAVGAGTSNDVADSCQGDSGGPMFCERDGKMFQAGIVSYGGRCGDPQDPGVYTNVHKYQSWIANTINNN